VLAIVIPRESMRAATLSIDYGTRVQKWAAGPRWREA
jgi:hypothetical protein